MYIIVMQRYSRVRQSNVMVKWSVVLYCIGKVVYGIVT